MQGARAEGKRALDPGTDLSHRSGPSVSAGAVRRSLGSLVRCSPSRRSPCPLTTAAHETSVRAAELERSFPGREKKLGQTWLTSFVSHLTLCACATDIPSWFRPQLLGPRLAHRCTPHTDCPIFALGRPMGRTCFDGDAKIAIASQCQAKRRGGNASGHSAPGCPQCCQKAPSLGHGLIMKHQKHHRIAGKSPAGVPRSVVSGALWRRGCVASPVPIFSQPRVQRS